jgi:transcriptional regulator with XRE-family HTH domain
MRALAQRAGGSYVTIARIESGAMSPTVALLERLAHALDIHMTDLFPPKHAPRTNKTAPPRTKRGA